MSDHWSASRFIEVTRGGQRGDVTADVLALSRSAERLREALEALWADGSVRAAVGEGCALYAKVGALVGTKGKGA